MSGLNPESTSDAQSSAQDSEGHRLPGEDVMSSSPRPRLDFLGPGAAVGIAGASLWLSAQSAAGLVASLSTEQPVPHWLVPTGTALMVVGALLAAPSLLRLGFLRFGGIRDISRGWELACVAALGVPPIVVAATATDSQYRWQPLVLLVGVPIGLRYMRRPS